MVMSVESTVGYYNQALIFMSSSAVNLRLHFPYCLLHLKFLKWLTSGRYRFTSGAKTMPANKSAVVVSFTINL